MVNCSRYLFLVSYLDYPFYAGLSVRINGLVKVLCERGIRVTVLAPIFRLDRPLSNESSCNIVYVDERWLRRLGSECLIVKILAGFVFSLIAFTELSIRVLRDASIVQYQSIYSAIPAVLTKIFWRNKIIGDDINMLVREDMSFHPPTYFLDRLVLWLTDVVVTASPYTYTFMKRLFPKKTVIYVPNGVYVDQKNFEKEKKIVRNRLLFVGSLSFNQNLRAVESILEMASVLEKRRIDFQVLVVGGPVRCAKHLLRQPIVKKGYVRFLGQVSTKDLQKLYHTSVAGLLPYFDDNPLLGGQRIKGLEYFANGLLVVSGPQGVKGIDRLVAGEHYLLAESSNKMIDLIEEILACHEKYSDLSIKGHDFVKENFSWESITKNYVEIVKCLLAR